MPPAGPGPGGRPGAAAEHARPGRPVRDVHGTRQPLDARSVRRADHAVVDVRAHRGGPRAPELRPGPARGPGRGRPGRRAAGRAAYRAGQGPAEGGADAGRGRGAGTGLPGPALVERERPGAAGHPVDEQRAPALRLGRRRPARWLGARHCGRAHGPRWPDIRRGYARALPGALPPTDSSSFGLADGLDLDATLPPDAAPTGHASDGVELWLAPSDRRQFAYLVDAADPSHVERWVRPARPMICR